jgi:hypothetical protein
MCCRGLTTSVICREFRILLRHEESHTWDSGSIADGISGAVASGLEIPSVDCPLFDNVLIRRLGEGHPLEDSGRPKMKKGRKVQTSATFFHPGTTCAT